MAEFGVDFYLIIALSFVELVILAIFTVLYVQKKQPAFQSLIISVFLFLLGNIVSIVHIIEPNISGLLFFQGLLGAAGLAPIVVFLEIFENGTSFNQRSSSSVIFILLIGAAKGASKLLVVDFHGSLEVELGNFFCFIAPILFILVGSLYSNTLSKMKDRIRFENQKKKIRKVKTGVYLTFIIPKFISGSIFTMSILPAFIFKNFDVNLVLGQTNIFDFIVNAIQIIGIVVLSLPIIFSNSVFFMQSRKVSRLIVINKDAIPIFEFPFEKEDTFCDDMMLKEAYNATSTIMKDGGVACQALKSMNFSDVQIMVDIRDNFAVLLVTDRPTLFLNKAVESFANDFQLIFPQNPDLDQIRTQKIKFTAEKMIQKNFGLEQEEFEQIRSIVQVGFDKVGSEYSKMRSESDEEVQLLPDFMNRLPTGARVLDAGCGAGEPITRILSERFKVVGVDISRKQIEAARKILPYCEFVWQDMTTLTYPDEYFDGIISYYAIPHVPREEHKGLVDNFYRMLKEDGYVLLCFGTDDDPGTVIDGFFGVKMYWSSFDAGTNVEMLRESGFHVTWQKFIFDDLTEEQHIFVLAQKQSNELLDEIKETKEKEPIEDFSSTI